MATVDFTLTFASDIHGLVNYSGPIVGYVFQHQPGDGTPAGCLEFTSNGSGGGLILRSGAPFTWEALGVPAGAVVHGVEVLSLDLKTAAYSTPGVGFPQSTYAFRIIGWTDNVPVGMDAGGINTYLAGGDQDKFVGGWHTASGLGLKPVSTFRAASNWQLKYELAQTISQVDSGPPAGVTTYRMDTIRLRITYQAAVEPTGTKLYLRRTNDDPIAGFRRLDPRRGNSIAVATVNTVGSGTDIQWTEAGGGTVLAWASGRAPPGGWTLAGSIRFNIWGDESGAAANAKLRARLWKRTAAGVETLIYGSPFDDDVELGISPGVFTWTPLTAGETFAEDDRLVVRFYITNAVALMGGGFFCELIHNGPVADANGDSYLQLVETVAFKWERGELFGASAGSTVTSASLVIPVDLHAAAAGGTVTTGNLRRGLTRLIAALAVGATLASAYLAIPVNLHGAATGGTAASASLTIPVNLHGAAVGGTATAASLVIPVNLHGASAGGTVTAGTLRRGYAVLLSSAAGATATTARLVIPVNLIGAATGGTATGATKLQIPVNLHGAATGGTATTGLLRRGLTRLTGAAAAGATATAAALVIPVNLHGASAGATVTTASLVIPVNLHAAITSGTVTVGTLRRGKTSLLSVSAGATVTTASLVIPVNLIGAASGGTAAAATLAIPINLTGAAAGGTAASASLVIPVNLIGAAAGGTATAAALVIPVNLVGSSAGATAAAAYLAIPINLVGSASGGTAASASLLIPINLVGAAAGGTAANASLVIPVNLVAASGGGTATVGNLRRGLTRLTGALAVGATATSATRLLIPVELHGAAASGTTLAALLRHNPYLLASSISSGTTATASLIIPVNLVGAATGATAPAATIRRNYLALWTSAAGATATTGQLIIPVNLTANVVGATTITTATLRASFLGLAGAAVGETITTAEALSVPIHLSGAAISSTIAQAGDPIPRILRQRTRLVNVAVGGSFTGDPDLWDTLANPGTGALPFASGSCSVTFGDTSLGGSVVARPYSLETRIIVGPPGTSPKGQTRYSYVVYVSVTRQMIGLPSQTWEFAGAPVYSDWFETSSPVILNEFRPTGSGGFSSGEQWLLTEEIKLDATYQEPYAEEFKRVVNAAMTVSFSGTIGIIREVTPGVFRVVPVAVGGTGTAAYTEPVGTHREMYYGHKFHFSNLSINRPLSGSVEWSDPSLGSEYGSVNTRKGSAVLSGDANHVTFAWTGGNGTGVSIHSPAPGGGFWLGTTLMNADVEVKPSWRLKLNARVKDYKTGNPVVATMQHRYHGDMFGFGQIATVLGAWNTNVPYLWPSEGHRHFITTTCDDGAGGYQVGVVITSTGGLSVPFNQPLLGALNILDNLLLPRQSEFDQSNIFMTMEQHAFEFNNAWGDTFGSYLRSARFRVKGRPRPHELTVSLAPAFPTAALGFAQIHPFQVFDQVAKWRVPSDAQIGPAAYGQGAAISADGPLVVNVATRSLITTQAVLPNPPLKRWIYCGYRYVKLRMMGSVAGKEVIFGVGRPNNYSFPAHGWKITILQANVWQEVVLDMALPNLLGDSDGWGESDNAPVHPSYYFHELMDAAEPAGAAIWIDLAAGATYQFESLVGTLDMTGDRTPVRLYYPLEGGTDSELYDQAAPPSNTDNVVSSAKILRAVVNGARAFDVSALLEFGETTETHDKLWQKVKGRLDNVLNDTGITVTPSVDPARVLFRIIEGCNYTRSMAGLEFGHTPAPGDLALLYGIVRTRLRTDVRRVYYGFGNPLTGGYGSTIELACDWVFNGEVCGLAPGADTSIALHDNSTGAEVAAAFFDDDNFYRLFAKYGVRNTYQNLDDTDQTILTPPFYTPQGLKMNDWWLRGAVPGVESNANAYLVDPLSAAGDLYRPTTLDRYPWWLDLYAPPKAGDWPCLVRHYTWRLYAFMRSTTGSMITLRYNRYDASPTTTEIDPDTNCKTPAYWSRDGILEGVHLRETTPILARSRTHGETWAMTPLPGNYTASSAAPHRNRLVMIGFRAGVLYVQVGKPVAGGTYQFAFPEVALALAQPKGRFFLRPREDGVLELLWQNEADLWFVSRCANLGLNGVGSWS